jgi:hypothetical protein
MKDTHLSSDAVVARRMVAQAAIFGSEALTSGKTDIPYLAEKRVARRLLMEAQAAYRAWVTWEAINSALTDTHATGQALNWLGLSLESVRLALARDAVLNAFRLSDPFEPRRSGDRISLCRLADLLGDGNTRQLLSSRQWALDLGYDPREADWAALKNKERVELLTSLVVSDWNKGTPTDTRLLDLRVELKPVRNSIAHAFETREVEGSPLSVVGQFINLTLELATDWSMLLNGSAEPLEHTKSLYRTQANRLWSWALKAPVESYEQHRLIPQAGFADE